MVENITELFSKIMDACKSDSIRIFVIICGCLYVLGFSFNMDGYNINYANLVINLYIALFCSYAWEKVKHEYPKLGDRTIKGDEANVPSVDVPDQTKLSDGSNATDNAVLAATTRAEKRNLLLNHRISIAQHDIHNVAMKYISIQELTEEDYAKIREDLENDKQRFFIEYCWLYKLVNQYDGVTEEIRSSIYDVYDLATEELCETFKKTENATDRFYGLSLIQKEMSKSLSEIFGCDEIIITPSFVAPQNTDNTQ